MIAGCGLTVSIDAELVDAGRVAVAEGRVASLSAWVNGALADRMDRDARRDALAAAVEAYEAEFGVISEQDVAAQEADDRRSALRLRRGVT